MTFKFSNSSPLDLNLRVPADNGKFELHERLHLEFPTHLSYLGFPQKPGLLVPLHFVPSGALKTAGDQTAIVSIDESDRRR